MVARPRRATLPAHQPASRPPTVPPARRGLSRTAASRAPRQTDDVIRRLNHAVLYVSDARRSADFYRDVLGFTTAQEEAGGRAIFMRAGNSSNHHDLGLFTVGPAGGATGGADAGRPAGRRHGAPSPGLYHLAWQVDTIDELAAVHDRLVAARALVGASDHGASKSLYAADPDGIEFEVMWMVPEAEWGAYAARAIVAPLDLDAERRRWSGVSTRV